VLDHDDERRLAEIENYLRLDDPELWGLFGMPAIDADDLDRPSRSQQAHPMLRSLGVLALSLVVTTLTTLLFGPNLGGLVAVLSLCSAGMYAYQTLRVCPGLRPAAGDD
jgi:hypothetical protein